MALTNENYSLASCYIPFRDIDFFVAVRPEEKALAEVLMSKAYDCWAAEDAEQCIIPCYDENAICQTPYGDFIIEWLREKGIPCNEEIGLIALDSNYMEEP